MPRARLAAVAALLVVAVFLVYAPVRQARFLELDDALYVTDNPVVRAGLTGDGVRAAFFGSRGGLWMPVAFLSHMVDVQLFGLDPAGPHLVNVALHAANAILLLLLLLRTTGAAGPSVAVAALFALHPLRVESVAWIAERKDVLSACFGLLAMHAWVGWVRRPTAGRYLAVVVAAALACLAKPMLVTLPALLLLLDLWPLRRLGAGGATLGRLVVEKLPLLVLAGAVAAVTMATARAGGALETLAERPLGTRLAHAAVSTVWYVGKTLCPVGLGAFYPYRAWAWWQIAGAIVALAAAAGVAAAARRRAPWIAVGLAWFAIALAPVLGLLQAGSQGTADRFTYLPSVGLIVAVVWTASAAAGAPGTRRALGVVAAGLAVALAVGSARQVGYWRDTRTLYERALAVTEDNWFVEAAIGPVLVAAGEPALAYAHAERAYRLEPRNPKASYALGLAAQALGRADEAEARYRDTIRLDRLHARAHNNLGVLLFDRRATDEALHELTQAARLDPTSAEIVGNLRQALAHVGVDDADGYLRRLVALGSAASADRARPGGATYGSTLLARLVGPRAEAVRGCFHGGTPAPFDLYVAIAADGSVEDVVTSPPTALARCFGDELRDARAPAPPFAPFHALMSMQFGAG